MSAVKSQADVENRPASMYLVLVAGIMAISFGAIFIRYAQNAGMPSILIAGSRVLIAALLITPVTLQHHLDEIRQITRADWLWLSASGLFLALHFAFWVSSLEHTTVLISVTLVTTTPIWTALLEIFVLRTGLRQTLLIGLGIALVGGVVIGMPSPGETAVTLSDNLALGVVLSLAGAVAIAIYLIIGRKVRSKLSLLPYIWIVYGTAGIVLALVVTAQQVPVTGYGWQGYASLLALATVPQLIGHTSLNYAVKYVSATYVSIATKLEPIGSAILAYFLFAEIPNRWQFIGSIVILVGIIIASLDYPKQREPQQE